MNISDSADRSFKGIIRMALFLLYDGGLNA